MGRIMCATVVAIGVFGAGLLELEVMGAPWAPLTRLGSQTTLIGVVPLTSGVAPAGGKPTG